MRYFFCLISLFAALTVASSSSMATESDVLLRCTTVDGWPTYSLRVDRFGSDYSINVWNGEGVSVAWSGFEAKFSPTRISFLRDGENALFIDIGEHGKLSGEAILDTEDFENARSLRCQMESEPVTVLSCLSQDTGAPIRSLSITLKREGFTMHLDYRYQQDTDLLVFRETTPGRVKFHANGFESIDVIRRTSGSWQGLFDDGYGETFPIKCNS